MAPVLKPCDVIIGAPGATRDAWIGPPDTAFVESSASVATAANALV
jgi:hypothetical protein